MSQEQREKYKNEIIARFSAGERLSTIAERLKINRFDVRLVLEAAGLYKTVTHSEKREAFRMNAKRIYEEYHNGQSLKTLAAKYGFTPRTLSHYLQEAGYSIKSPSEAHQIHTIWSNAFEKRTIESCYWAGLLAADGCVFYKESSKVARGMTISLKEQDKESIEKFRNYLRFSGPLYFHKGNFITLTIANEKIVSDLRDNFNITPNKSLIYTPPNDLLADHAEAFALGMLDGDGCLTYYQTSTGRKHFTLSITGTKDVCEWMQSLFNTHVVLQQRYPERNNNNWSYSVQGNLQIEAILSRLYNHSTLTQICMQRKFQKYLTLKNQIFLTHHKVHSKPE